MFKKNLFLIMLTFMLTVISCYDDTEEDCEEAPPSCEETHPVKGTLNFNVTIDDDNTSVVIDLRSGKDFDTGETVELITMSSASGSRYMDVGTYSAMVRYTVNYEGKVYTVEAVDGANLMYSSSSYCGGVTCYEEETETLNLEFDREAFIAMQESSSKKCFIATAAYGSGSAWQVEYLRSFRDRVLKNYAAGRFFIKEYYAHSPAAADFISEHTVMKYSVMMILSLIIYSMMHPVVFFVLFSVSAAAIFSALHVLKARRRLNYTA